MISITVPIYNEAQNIPILHSRVGEALEGLEYPWELVLVNDGSPMVRARFSTELPREIPR